MSLDFSSPDRPAGNPPVRVAALAVPLFEAPHAVQAAWLARLPPPRQAALARLQDASARQASLLGSALLWHGLQAMGFGTQALASLRHLPSGRPTLALPVHFSLSHGGRFVVCVLSADAPVGVDVEAIGPVDAQEFAHYLSDEERAWAGHDPARFYTLWTCKEAIVKAAGGAGLRDLPRVATLDGGRTGTLDGRAWSTLPLPLDGEHIAHLALPDDGRPVDLDGRLLDRATLVRDAARG